MIKRLAMVMWNQKTIPDEIVYTYVAFLKNYDKVAVAIENYYTEPTSIGRTRLVQEVAKPQTGTYSEKIRKANKVIESILDPYNGTQPIDCMDPDWVDIDLEDIVDKLFLQNKPMVNNPHHPFRRVK